MARSCWVFGIALCALARSAAAQGPVHTSASLAVADADSAAPVVLLDAPPTLSRALRTALSPWGLRLASSSRPRPESSLPAAASSAQQLARELGARALVWTSADAHGAALWLYEAARDSVRVRTFPDRPLDDARAASLALSVKTWLLSAEAAPQQALASSTPEPVLAAPGSLVPAALEPGATESGARPVRTPPAPPARGRLLVHAAAGAGGLQPAAVEGRYGLELRAAAWRDPATSLWLAAQVEAGEPQTVSTDGLRADYTHWGGGVSLGVGRRLAAAWSVQLLAGVALERTTLSGTWLPEGVALERSRWQAVLQLRPELELALAPVALLLQPTLCAAPRQQRYLIDGTPVLSSRPVWWSLGGAIGVNLF